MDRIQIIAALVAALPGARVVACPALKKGCQEFGWADKGLSDEASIAAVFSDEKANVGLVIGSRVAVIDIEGPRKKAEAARKGLEEFADLEAKYGKLRPTVEVTTPSGGRHLYFRLPEGVFLKTQPRLAGSQGVELRTGRNLMMAPPSRVLSADGGIDEYQFVAGRAPWDIEVAELDPGWVELGAGAQHKPQSAAPQIARDEDERNRDADWQPVVNGCAFASWAAGEGAVALPEPLWHAFINLTSYSKDGRQVAHAASSVYPGYSAAETDRKFDYASKASPYTCEYIAGALGFNGCRRCALRAMDAISPIALGYVAEAMASQQVRWVYDIVTRRYHNVSNYSPPLMASVGWRLSA